METDRNTVETADMRPYLDDMVALYGVFMLAAENWAKGQVKKAGAKA